MPPEPRTPYIQRERTLKIGRTTDSDTLCSRDVQRLTGKVKNVSLAAWVGIAPNPNSDNYWAPNSDANRLGLRATAALASIKDNSSTSMCGLSWPMREARTKQG